MKMTTRKIDHGIHTAHMFRNMYSSNICSMCMMKQHTFDTRTHTNTLVQPLWRSFILFNPFYTMVRWYLWQIDFTTIRVSHKSGWVWWWLVEFTILNQIEWIPNDYNGSEKVSSWYSICVILWLHVSVCLMAIKPHSHIALLSNFDFRNKSHFWPLVHYIRSSVRFSIDVDFHIRSHSEKKEVHCLSDIMDFSISFVLFAFFSLWRIDSAWTSFGNGGTKKMLLIDKYESQGDNIITFR